MLILDHPYISDFLKETSFKLGLPVLGNQAAREFGLDEKEVLFGEKDFVNRIKEAKEPLVYCNSENPIQWIADNLSFTGLPDKIEAFKDKYRFRGLLRTMYPDFFYRQVEYNELEELEIEEIPLPFIIKPSVGFFSIGVYKVNESSEWSNVVEQIHREVETMPSRFPAEVINTGKFIIEQCIEGEEFAVDAYFDREGRPVILNILKHLFSSGEDVSDRVYITSKEIMRVFYDKFFPVLEGIGRLTGAKRFPIHAEFRINPEGVVVPIEVNPMRFAGWCTTDIAFYAFGVNVYEYFFEQKKPDWEAILSRMDDKLYSIIVGDLPKGLDPGKVDVDYHRLLSAFEHVLELRKINYRRHGVFAFVFTETRAENRQELDAILQSDLTEFVKKPR